MWSGVSVRASLFSLMQIFNSLAATCGVGITRLLQIEGRTTRVDMKPHLAQLLAAAVVKKSSSSLPSATFNMGPLVRKIKGNQTQRKTPEVNRLCSLGHCVWKGNWSTHDIYSVLSLHSSLGVFPVSGVLLRKRKSLNLRSQAGLPDPSDDFDIKKGLVSE